MVYDFGQSRGTLPHQDNARPHTSIVANDFPTEEFASREGWREARLSQLFANRDENFLRVAL